jgi:hypothetical protein
MSLTIVVPATLPSDLHSSMPFAPSVAAKTTKPRKAVMPVIELPAEGVGLMSLTKSVPAPVRRSATARRRWCRRWPRST